MCKNYSKKGNMCRDQLTQWIFPFLENFLHIILSTFYGKKRYGLNQGGHKKSKVSPPSPLPKS